jgi:hypothetical protein
VERGRVPSKGKQKGDAREQREKLKGRCSERVECDSDAYGVCVDKY